MKNDKAGSKISIVMCTFNREKYITKAIDSVLKQEYKNWELIIVDDGSTDNTRKKLEKYLSAFKNIIYLKQNNRGPAEARNLGIKFANGGVVTFLDSDDTIMPEHLTKRNEVLKNTNIDFVYGGVKFVGPKKLHYVCDLENPGKKIFLGNCSIAGTFFIRKKILDKVNGFPKVEFGEDYELMKLLSAKYKSEQIKYATYKYNVLAENRLCHLYDEGGVEKINNYRKLVN